MNLSSLLYLPEGLQVRDAAIQESCVVLVVCSHRAQSSCPRCGRPSGSIHSTYQRTVADVPCIGRQMILHLPVRKFRCRTPTCSQHIFTERLPEYLRPWARKTLRCMKLISTRGMALGGRGTEQVAPALGVQVSDQTTLRVLAQIPEPVTPAVTVLGVDDFAFRRGRASGTILLDLERQRVIDVLPDRTQETCARWVQQHPQVQFISRDRGGDYAAGARAGAPQAVQIADRFHLLKNAGEALERGLTRHASVLRQAAQSLTPADAVTRTTKRTPGDARRQQERRAARQARYEQVMTLHQQGLSPRQIAQQTGVARGTVLTYLRAPSFPEVAPRPRPRHIDPYMAYLRERWNAGEHNARALWREIRVQGYQAGDEQVRRVVNAWRTDPHWHGNQPSIPQGPAKAEQMTMSAHKTRWLLWKAATDLTSGEAAYVERLIQLCPQIGTARDLIPALRVLLSERQVRQLDRWLAQSEQSGISEVVGCAQGIRRDLAAVRAALQDEWSQGQTEDQVNRLKMLKRQMYGRASFALLRRRVLGQTALAP